MAKARKWLKNTPWARGLAYLYSKDNNGKGISAGLQENDLLFCLLVWVGLPRSYAFALAYPESKADEASKAQLASRLMQSWKVWGFFNAFARNEKTMEFRYTTDMDFVRHPNCN